MTGTRTTNGSGTTICGTDMGVGQLVVVQVTRDRANWYLLLGLYLPMITKAEDSDMP
jgi:hypothetical protein